MWNTEDWKHLLEKRLETLGWTLYKVAKKYAEILKQDSPAVRYHTAISKCFEIPQKSKLQTVENIIKSLGGKLYVVWDDDIEVKQLPLNKATTNQLIDEIKQRTFDITPSQGLIKIKYSFANKNPQKKLSSSELIDTLNNTSKAFKVKND